jgi:hypothetical protein
MARTITTRYDVAEHLRTPEEMAAYPLPAPEERRLVFFVREPWPSVATGTKLSSGLIQERKVLEIVSGRLRWLEVAVEVVEVLG